MKRKSVHYLLVPFILMGCQKAPKVYADGPKTERIVVQSTSKTDTLKPVTDAVRGQAERILKPLFFPNSTFVLLGDSITGIETAQLKNGDKLILTNCGFEYFTLSFRFETSRIQRDTTDLPFWSRQAIEMMQGIEPGLDSPLDIRLGTKKFQEFLDGEAKINYANMALGKEIDYGGEEIREFVWLKRIERIDAERTAIEINYSMGPL